MLSLEDIKQQNIYFQNKTNRILLFLHTSQCTLEDCPFLCCNKYKNLWKHVSMCKKIDCNIEHCNSSKYIINHFMKCQDHKCKICSYVNIKQQIILHEQAIFILSNMKK